jgi:hypothetical protein
MEKLKEFQEAARKHGFVEAEETEDGTVLWLKRPTVDAEDRICIDSVSNSATVYWATIPWQIKSKTFRVAAGLEQWLASAIAGNSPV